MPTARCLPQISMMFALMLLGPMARGQDQSTPSSERERIISAVVGINDVSGFDKDLMTLGIGAHLPFESDMYIDLNFSTGSASSTAGVIKQRLSYQTYSVGISGFFPVQGQLESFFGVGTGILAGKYTEQAELLGVKIEDVSEDNIFFFEPLAGLRYWFGSFGLGFEARIPIRVASDLDEYDPLYLLLRFSRAF